MEIWKEIPNYFGYQVSNLGKIRSFLKSKEQKILKLSTDKDGYKRIGLKKEKKERIWYVHRLVMISFVGEVPDKKEVNHKNGIKADNRLENLEYVSKSDNHLHAYHCLSKKRGEKSHLVKITKDQAYNIKYVETGTQREIAKKYSIGQSQVFRIKNNKSWVGL